MSRLTRDGAAEPVSRNQILRREREQGNINVPRSADHEQDWQPYPVDPYSCCMYDHTTYLYICEISINQPINGSLAYKPDFQYEKELACTRHNLEESASGYYYNI